MTALVVDVQHGFRRRHLRRRVAGDVDHGVDATAAQRREIAVAVAAQLLERGEEVRVLPAAVEERDLVGPRECGLDDVTPTKTVVPPRMRSFTSAFVTLSLGASGGRPRDMRER